VSEPRKEQLADGVTLWMGDCREVMPMIGHVDAVISDPPYEAVMQNKWGSLHVDRFAGMDGGAKRMGEKITRFQEIGFDAIDEMRGDVARVVCASCTGWIVLFCMAEGVRAWRDEIEAAGAKYKRAMVWVKPDAMPQFNGQGPSVGHEMMVSAWCGKGRSSWNGGGKPGTFVYTKNTLDAVHPTQKPLPLISELVFLFSDAGDLVCDPFMGSGTTGVACLNLGRSFIGIEHDQGHFDGACRRISDLLKRPRLPFEELRKAVQTEMTL
jgi:DNA modification methylase